MRYADPDETLVLRIRQGESAVFAELVNRYAKCLLNYLARLVGDPDDAEDLLQDLFVRVFRHLDSYDPGRPFRPWIYRIATRLGYDHRKKRKKNAHLSLDAPLGDDGSLADLLPDTRLTPERALAQQEALRELDHAVGELPAKQREAFILFHFEKLAYQEIAEALAIPLGTVKSRLHAASARVLLDLAPEPAGGAHA
jgi:RNA polymerase sigma-70 factor (ECF subfamily)